MLVKERFEHTAFSGSEQILVDFILANPEKIKDMTTKEIAAETFTSPSTLIRIAHKMEFEGWNDLKEAYLKEHSYLQSHFNEVDANFPFKNNDTIMSIASKIALLKQEAIADTHSLVEHDTLQKAVRIIEDAAAVYVFAVSNNLLISREFRHNMARIQKRVELIDTQGDIVYTAANIEPGACAIILSYSGETPILKRVISALKANQVPVIGITSIG